MIRVPAGFRLTGKAREEQIQRMRQLASMPDSEINTEDIPELTPEQLGRMKRGLLYRPMKHQVTVRLDADILAWAKRDGRGYQTRINTILRKAMLKDLAAAPKSKGRKAS